MASSILFRLHSSSFLDTLISHHWNSRSEAGYSNFLMWWLSSVSVKLRCMTLVFVIQMRRIHRRNRVVWFGEKWGLLPLEWDSICERPMWWIQMQLSRRKACNFTGYWFLYEAALGSIVSGWQSNVNVWSSIRRTEPPLFNTIACSIPLSCKHITIRAKALVA
jgi:hypothetical protein